MVSYSARVLLSSSSTIARRALHTRPIKETSNPEFLTHLKSLYPTKHDLKSGSPFNPWYLIASVTFAACNLPEAVPLVYRHAHDGLGKEEDPLLLVRKIKDALFKAGLGFGYPKTINALAALHKVVPEHLRDYEPLRDVTRPIDELQLRGLDNFHRTYGEITDEVLDLLNKAYPDLAFFSRTFAYGYVYSFPLTTPLETSYILLSALIPQDVARQIDWHLGNSLRNGASKEEVRAVRRMVIECVEKAGVRLRDRVPEL